jgi:hypothetical protein
MLDRALAPALLSSKQLNSLDYVIYTDYPTYSPFYWEWPEITRLLQKGGNCKSLCLHIQNSTYEMVPKIFESPKNIGKFQFQLRSGSNLPPLEELSITSEDFRNQYDFDHAHCAMLRDCIDWSRMRKLDFGDDCPVPLLTELCGRVPNLESLRLRPPDPQGGDSQPVAMFVESVLALKSLDLMDRVLDGSALAGR